LHLLSADSAADAATRDGPGQRALLDARRVTRHRSDA
jgi:hypothetical protein